MKSFKHTGFKLGNLTINSVLDGIVVVSQIDPSWVQPDHSLQNDLELSHEEILKIGQIASLSLGLKLSPSDEAQLKIASTPRDLVNKIETFLERKSAAKAG